MFCEYNYRRVRVRGENPEDGLWDGASGYTGESNLELEFIRGRGNSSWRVEKKPFKLKLDKKGGMLDRYLAEMSTSWEADIKRWPHAEEPAQVNWNAPPGSVPISRGRPSRGRTG